MSIVKSIPEEWKKKLQENNTESKISISDEFLGPAGVKQICKLTSKNIYNSLFMYDNICTAKQKLANNIEFREVDWKSLCQAVYRVTNDTYTRQFQYKIIHNYLPTNSLLFNYKLTDSNRCTFCFKHLFANVCILLPFIKESANIWKNMM